MNEQQAIEKTKAYINDRGFADYPVDNLVAERFEIGWTVYSPDKDPTDLDSIRMGKKVFLVGDNGYIEESSSSTPPGQAETEFTRKYQ